MRAATCTRPEEWFCTPAVALVVPLVHAEAAERAEAAGSTDAAPRAIGAGARQPLLCMLGTGLLRGPEVVRGDMRGHG